MVSLFVRLRSTSNRHSYSRPHNNMEVDIRNRNRHRKAPLFLLFHKDCDIPT